MWEALEASSANTDDDRLRGLSQRMIPDSWRAAHRHGWSEDSCKRAAAANTEGWPDLWDETRHDAQRRGRGLSITSCHKNHGTRIRTTNPGKEREGGPSLGIVHSTQAHGHREPGCPRKQIAEDRETNPNKLMHRRGRGLKSPRKVPDLLYGCLMRQALPWRSIQW